MFKRFVQNGKNLISKENSSILSAAAIIMFATLISALLGFVRTRLLIQYFFADKSLLDVFWAAFRIPDTIFQILIVGALSSAFIPVFSQYLEHEKQEETNLIASSMINSVVGVMLVFTFIIFIWAEPLCRLVAGGFSPEQIMQMAQLTRIMAGAQVLFGFSSFITGIIQSHKRFLVPAFAPSLYNVGIILGTVLFSKSLGIMGPALGVVLGALLHLLAQLPLVYKLGFNYRPTIHIHPAIKEMTYLMIPRMITLSLSQIEQTTLIAFSSWLSNGSVTIITIAQQLTNLPIRLIGVTIGQASLPFFAKEAAKNNLFSLAKMVNDSILQMLYLALPASAIILILRIPLVRLAYGANSFLWSETVTTGKLVAMFALAIAAGSLSHIIIRVFYALHDTKTPFIINLISTSINVGLSYYLLFILKTGIVGMAFAITLADILETTILTIILYKVAQFSLSEIAKPFGKMLLAGAITTMSLWIPLRVLDQLIFDTTHTFPLIILTIMVVLIGIAVYVFVSYLLHIRELEVFMTLAKKIGDWKSALSATSESLESTETPV
ncbi:murein biosynthesis integral membrane protein MurJ [Candidatus Collierbacteria bacterium CG10_big_fil_rev_8_21_14_0_10_44_9]|uniref:Probable lipid II flippase MurJ n=1 Tax=Candidatus Collierbacteria bacterium CG10_big_fil_rev_8_21_14_0_10_44_9 TaxID=1974535 RepID=A0A2H0VI74_9BACT|nr:MAG: murein biosynthesis integral membrane protein MurJ [Candidatus Collierbacteria bacterium CG10_big_fil_rev_8_21_14_0_10_44_9]